MKKLLTVYCFELGNYFKSKTYVLSTLLICVLAIVGISIPSILSAVSGGDSSDEKDSVIAETIAICDPEGIVSDDLILSFGKADIQRMDSEQQIRDAVVSEEVEAGFVIRSTTEFDYFVFNQSAFSDTAESFRNLMSTAAKMKYCEDNDLNYEDMAKMDEESIVCHEQILGKDSESNYWYSYVLVILVFMIIVMYGMMIATSVANEKSNRTVEILVTSTTSSSLLFGKVFAGATAIIFQIGLIFSSILGAYQFNKDSLGGVLDMLLDIPVEVLVDFCSMPFCMELWGLWFPRLRI